MAVQPVETPWRAGLGRRGLVAAIVLLAMAALAAPALADKGVMQAISAVVEGNCHCAVSVGGQGWRLVSRQWRQLRAGEGRLEIWKRNVLPELG